MSEKNIFEGLDIREVIKDVYCEGLNCGLKIQTSLLISRLKKELDEYVNVSDCLTIEIGFLKEQILDKILKEVKIS